MKRSEINTIMRQALQFLAEQNFRLPPFAAWSPQDWRSQGPHCRRIVDQQLGWDITDFGSGSFDTTGLFLFTLRNGVLTEQQKPGAKTYAEKIMIVRENQITPTHYHFQKTEDIINRGGGDLAITVWNADDNDGLADTPVTLESDGVLRTLDAGEPLILHPGESICLEPKVYHTFHGVPGRGTVLVGEVSRVNDDRTDNRFLKPAGRFPDIDEDAPPLHLLVGDYPQWYRHVESN